MATTAVAGFRYARLADELEVKIKNGIYRSGEKMPSLRKLMAAADITALAAGAGPPEKRMPTLPIFSWVVI